MDRWPDLPGVDAVLRDAVDAGQAALDEHAAKAVLAALGIAVPRGVAVAADGDAAAAAAALRPPYALKALSPEPLHKSDIGAVWLGLGDSEAVAAAQGDIAGRMAGTPLAGFLVEEMAAAGVEIVVGGVTDPQFGPMLMLGAGGIHAEILRDVAFRLCPLTPRDAREMIDDLAIAPILRGARGRAPVDLGAIEAALLALGGADGFFARHADLVAEFDLNPLFARPDGLVAVDARIVLRHDAPAAPRRRAEIDLAPLLAPRSVAVVGASATGVSAGNRFVRVLQQHGFAGRIYPVHPTAAAIEGVPAVASLAALPEPADYAYLTVPAAAAEAVLAQGAGKIRFAQVMASAEPHDAAAFDARLRALAEAGGFRVVGPNCMGTHAPHAKLTFMEGVSTEPGPVGVACQSGGLGMDILRRGGELGLRFSALVTLGNCADLDPADLFAHFLADPGTTVIGMYLEDIKDGARFHELACENAGAKPVVVLVGGTTGSGRAAAASHTGALAASDAAWRALARQTGIVLTETLDAFLDALQLATRLVPQPVRDDPAVTLFGNGGGTSVLATDALDRAGFRLAVPTAAARAVYDAIALPPGASLANPIDLPASVLKEEGGRVAARILAADRELTRPYATIVHLNLPVIAGYRHVEGFQRNLMDAVLGGGAAGGGHTLLVLRSDRGAEADGWRREFRAAAAARGVPTFDEIPEAVAALACFHRYERFLAGGWSRG